LTGAGLQAILVAVQNLPPAGQSFQALDNPPPRNVAMPEKRREEKRREEKRREEKRREESPRQTVPFRG